MIASISSTWIPKICMIITALSMGLVSSLAPHMAESNTLGEQRQINAKLNQALGTLVLIAVPMGLGMILLSEPVFRLFYGESAYGSGILQLAVVVNVVGSMATVTQPVHAEHWPGKDRLRRDADRDCGEWRPWICL